MSKLKYKNGSNFKPQQSTTRQHLLTKIIKKHVQQPQATQVVECKYGIFCAHLRSEGKCSFPHRKNHYHFLNLVAPIDCLEDEEEQGKMLSKRQKKQKKIIEKTITSQIDVAALDHKQQLIKNKSDAQAKKQLIQMLEQTEKKVIELVESSSASAFFQKLNEISQQEVFEVKRKAMIQIRKKKQTLYNEIIDKEYRIANRLIKASLKSKDEQLYELYHNINHDTIPSIRQYFDRYFIQSQGIPQQKPQKTILKARPSLYLSNLLTKILFLQPQDYSYQYYFLQSKESSPIPIIANTIFYNMLIPFKMHKQMEYNMYFFVDCEDNLPFNRLSSYLNKEYMNIFSGKMKSPPEFAFGQREQNKAKFINWVQKILQKFKESKTGFKFILILDNVGSLFSEGKLQEFQQQKLRERQDSLLSLIEIFDPTIVFLVKEEVTMKIKQKICDLLSIDGDSLGENRLKM